MNPISTYNKIKDFYKLYLKTAFGTNDSEFEDKREQLLSEDKILTRVPWVEPLPTYKSSGYKIVDIQAVPNLDENELEIFKDLTTNGLIGNFEIYQHQHEMLMKSMNGENCVITSGTGSGKTESFLLPLFAYLSKEINKWKENQANLNNTRWWSDSGWGPAKFITRGNPEIREEVIQRSNNTRHAAVRALLVYPMNALVEDQISRLRLALDSNDIREVLEQKYNNNRVFFGRYNSNTPVAGKLYKNNDGEIEADKYKINDLKKQINLIQENSDDLDRYIEENRDKLNKEEIDTLYSNFQRLDGSESRTRFDIQETPPDILITNFSMLSIMLMRDVDNPIFQKTKDWLECNTEFDSNLSEEEKISESKERIFHIIIDELHLYRGGSGTETAYILRLLLSRLGLNPDHEQVKILASSASLDGDEGENFLRSFFGVEKKTFSIIKGEEKKPQLVDSNPLKDYSNEFSSLGKQAYKIENLDLTGNVVELDEKLKDNLNNYPINLVNLIVENQSQINGALYNSFTYSDRTRATKAFESLGELDEQEKIKSIAENLFGTENNTNSSAVEGFFLLIDLLDKNKIENDFPRMRFHLFYRNIPGLWGELVPFEGDNKFQIGKISNSPEISLNNHRFLELLYCENCGSIAFGGNRVKYKDIENNNTLELIPNSPDIEGVPENSPSTIVEKRKYKNFGVFFPSINELEITETENRIPNTDFEHKWKRAFLNANTGKISFSNDGDDFIPGYLLTIESSLNNDICFNEDRSRYNNINALPHTCPHCEADYSHPNKRKKSPFRGFRTGFGKVNEILSSQLFETIEDKKNKRKLVAFSDSREDAAKLSKNIEEEHYQTLLREIIIFNINNEFDLETNFIKIIEGNDNDEKGRIRTLNLKLYQEISTLVFQKSQEFEDAMRRYENIKNRIKSVQSLLDMITKSMLEFGVNPAGPLKSLEKHRGKEWDQYFNIENLEYNTQIDGWNEFRNEINNKLEENIASIVFSRLFYGFEFSGLGYACVKKDGFLNEQAMAINMPAGKLYEITNSFMRIMGNNFKHNRAGSDFPIIAYNSYDNISNKRKEKKFVKRVARHLRIEENILGNAVYSILGNNGHRGIIEINNLDIKFSQENDFYYKCEHCGTIHLHKSGGICVSCNNELTDIESGYVKDLWANNYLTYNLSNEEYKPFRLHSEELTGQTDNQLERQRNFKDIFFNEIDEKIKSIDLLSVTTTLEVGVDIGSLQSIYLSNMPPQRFNYQQRVGRTGRRGQKFSYALTFARGRSHDEFYFDNPFSITGDEPPLPFLSLTQEKIFKRVLNKAILQYIYSEVGELEGSVHGEFGDISNYNSNIIEQYLNNNEIQIKKIFDSLNYGIYNNHSQLEKYEYSNFKEYILNIPNVINDLINTNNKESGDMAEFLAEVGFLPMSGMPTRQRNLIHSFYEIENGTGTENYIPQVIDRNLDVAIFEFSPGSQKTKDKGVVQSIGFAPNISSIEWNYQSRNFEAKQFDSDAFSEKFWLILNEQTKKIISYPYTLETEIDDEETLKIEHPESKVFKSFVPSAFRTDFNAPKDSNEDFDINFSKPMVYAESQTNTKKNDNEENNYLINYSGQDKTWRINDNGGMMFNGAYSEQYKNIFGENRVLFENQWIDNSFSSNFTQKDASESISICSNKTTEVFRLSPSDLDFQLHIDPFDSNIFKSSSSKGAFYSAAFLLQRTLASDQDIDPEEIEIAAIDSIILPEVNGVVDRKSASIVLTDELPNGSGFVEKLFNDFDKYINLCINPTTEDLYNFQILENSDNFDASYTDLKNYRNMNFHPLLDWRLAVGLLRILNDKNYLSGLKEEDYGYKELKNWREFSEEKARFMEDNFQNIVFKKFGDLNGFTLYDIYNVIVTHPLWNYSKNQPFEGENILTKAVESAGIENLYFIDTFNLHRRPGFCYGELLRQITKNG